MPKTGATRYQKFLKSEKSKTKLKANKKELPKGTNITKVNFKVKKIIIQEQLKKKSVNEAVSMRKLNIKELLSRLNHFNTNARTDALNGLKELIAYPNVLEQNLGQLINGITPMVLNIERVVRHESFKVLHLMLSNVSKEKINPFFHILSTYLRSAMTHIDDRIQQDSLLFLDILLLSTAENVIKDFHKIIPNFLDMISKLRIDSKTGRTLTVNLNSQITSAKWRTKVLHRLKDFFEKFVECHKITSTDKSIATVTCLFDPTKLHHYPLFNSMHTSVCHVSCIAYKHLQYVEPLDEVNKFKGYIETLMPLLFETWIEVCPNMNSENIETLVSEDAAALLKNTLKVISLLWNLVQYYNKEYPSSKIESFFCQTYRQPFSQHVVQSFPYVTNVRLKQNRVSNSSLEKVVTDPKLIVENLEICELFIILNPCINIKGQNNQICSVLNYIEKTFNQNSHDNINDMIIGILHKMFSNEITNWTKTVSVMDNLLQKVILIYFSKDISSSLKQKIFIFLCEIALNNKLTHFHSSKAYEKWLNNIPDVILEESITAQTIDVIHNFVVQNENTFNTIIKPKLVNVIQNLPKIRVPNAVNVTSYHKLFSILYYVKCWNEEALNLLEKQLLANVYQSDHGKYIFDTLRLRNGIL